MEILTLGLKAEKKDVFELFFSSCAGGGGSGFAAASRVADFERSAFFFG